MCEFRVTANLNLTGTAAILVSVVNASIALKELNDLS